jgi:hypothetical protein
MKKIILIKYLLLFSSICFSQSLTVSELIKINNYHQDDFDTYLTKKGFLYYKNEVNDFSDATFYVYYLNGIEVAFVTKYYYKKMAKETVSYEIGNNSVYLKIKSELKTLGFKYINSNTLDETIFLNYKKGSIELSLASSFKKLNNGNNVNNYEISVFKYY